MVTLPENVRFQAAGCAANGSPLYERLLVAVADDLEAGGVLTTAILGPRAADPQGSALGLRFMGAVHRLVLTGAAPELARWYGSAGEAERGGRPAASATTDDPWPAFADVLAEHEATIIAGLAQGVQTNEVGRCAALLPGLLTVAARTGLPIRLREIGSSAGLNLRLDQHRYETEHSSWGDPEALLCFAGVYRGEPPFDQSLVIADRRGCDPSPIDPSTPEGKVLLRSFVWPDQAARLARLDAALAVAERVPAVVERAPAGQWVPQQLASAVDGQVTVVQHSIVWQYIPHLERARITASIEAAGAAATKDRPLAWLRMEPGLTLERADVVLRLWGASDGSEELLARTGYHGQIVEWRA